LAPILERNFPWRKPHLHKLEKRSAIKGIITESKAGREALLAKWVIDATGDADIAHRVGAPTHKTPLEDMQAASVMFHISGVDKTRFMESVRNDPQTYKDWSSGEWTVETSGKEDDMFSPFLKKPFEQAIKSGVIPANLNTISGTWGAVHDSGEMTYMNLVHLAQIDGTDPQSMTKGEIEGRKQAMLALDALRQFQKGCEKAKLRNFGATIGIRDTRKIDAKYNLTEADVRGEARFEDSIGIYPEFIDGYGVLIIPTTGRYMHIPLRSMLPKGVENLLVVGRAIGGDKIAHAATRNMACCAVAGQGAGIAAAIAIQTGKMDIFKIQSELKRQNVRIH
jgi:hypothetical protein